MEQIVDPANLELAWQNVRANHGAPGPDGISIAVFPDTFRVQWPTIRQQLRDGTYQPQAARRKAIPKDDGSERFLGIPNVQERLIQQAHPASPDADFRSRLLGIELRLSTQTLCSRSNQASATVYPRRLPPWRG
jgi:retron-type reverse transcriptase